MKILIIDGTMTTGWDWNKYNKTHYDHDNPPPKTIQGYKFAIFYPDLIDVTNTPKYFLESTGDGNRDFVSIIVVKFDTQYCKQIWIL